MGIPISFQGWAVIEYPKWKSATSKNSQNLLITKCTRRFESFCFPGPDMFPLFQKFWIDSIFQVHSTNPTSSNTKKLRFQLAKERKASTTLGIIMSAFIVCWLPFFVLALVRPFLRDSKAIPNSLSSIFLWLGYANSLLNPIIYATLNRDFRRPFQQILFFRCGSLNHMMREEFYHSQYGDPDPPQHFYMTGGSPEKTVVQNLKDVDDDIEIINSSSMKNSIQISKANESFLW